MAENTTMLNDLINPQVVADLVNDKLVDAIQVLPLCAVDRALEGRSGSKVLLPKFAYIGDAVDVTEGAAIPVKKLTASTVEVSIKKAGNGVELTDESILSGYGDPLGEAVRQLAADVGIPASLKGIVKEEDIPFLAESAYADACRPGNPRETSVEEIAALYRSLL